MTDVLTRWFDPALPVLDQPPEEIALAERERLIISAVTAQAASTMKRRLGSDATRNELTADKRISRQVAFFTLNLANRWGESSYEVPREINMIAAHINWVWWLEDKLVVVVERKRWIATWAVRFKHEKEGNIFLNLLEQEENSLLRVQASL